MVRAITLVFILFSTIGYSQQHCGFDFTSYLVLHVHENGKPNNISELIVSLVDADGLPAVNVNNSLSWSNSGKQLQFAENYKIDANGKRAAVSTNEMKWYFPYAKDTYLLSVTNEFPADNFQVKIEDPKQIYKSVTVQLNTYNMYVLCSTQQQAMQFGRRVNKPLEIILERN